MFEEITDFFENLIRQSGTYDIARSEFQRLVDDDDELRQQYSQWCEENGYSMRRGFDIYCEEFFNNQNSAMDSLKDYDEWT